MLIEALFVSIFVLLGEIQFVFRPAFSSSYFVLKKCYDYNQMSTFSGLISDWTSSMLGNSSPRCREGTKSSVESILSLNDDISGVSIVWLPLPTSMLSSMFSRKSSGVCGMDNVGPIPKTADKMALLLIRPPLPFTLTCAFFMVVADCQNSTYQVHYQLIPGENGPLSRKETDPFGVLYCCRASSDRAVFGSPAVSVSGVLVLIVGDVNGAAVAWPVKIGEITETCATDYQLLEIVERAGL